MDTEALIDRIRSLRDRIDVPASPAKKPVYQPELADETLPLSDRSAEDQPSEPDIEPDIETDIEPDLTEHDPLDSTDTQTDTLADTQADNKADNSTGDRTTRIADNLAAAMSSLNEDVYDVYANQSDVTALDMRMQMIESKLQKTQDMIVTLNRAVGRLIDYEEKHAEPALLMEQLQFVILQM